MLHLHIGESARADAMIQLEAHGFTPRLNGVGLIVPVPGAQKAAPFRVLAQARIAIEDFEVLSAAHAAPSTHAKESAP